jgi:hypothetical protein
MENKKNNEEDNRESDFYYALGHEIRREIIKNIGENGHSSFTNLKKTLRVSTGTIYHHLETLSQLIEQKKNKKYYLTDLGKYAFESLINNEKNITEGANFQFKNKYLRTFFKWYSNIVFPSDKRSYLRLYIFSTILIIIGSVLNSLNGFNSFLLFFTGSFERDFIIFNAITFILNLFAFFLIVEGICRLIYKNKTNTKILLSSFSFILSPMIVYSMLHLIFQLTGFLSNYILYFIDRIFFISLQVLSLWFLSFQLNLLKDLKINQGLTLSLVLHLAGFAVIFIITVQF